MRVTDEWEKNNDSVGLAGEPRGIRNAMRTGERHNKRKNQMNPNSIYRKDPGKDRTLFFRIEQMAPSTPPIPPTHTPPNLPSLPPIPISCLKGGWRGSTRVDSIRGR